MLTWRCPCHGLRKRLGQALGGLSGARSLAPSLPATTGRKPSLCGIAVSTMMIGRCGLARSAARARPEQRTTLRRNRSAVLVFELGRMRALILLPPSWPKGCHK